MEAFDPMALPPDEVLQEIAMDYARSYTKAIDFARLSNNDKDLIDTAFAAEGSPQVFIIAYRISGIERMYSFFSEKIRESLIEIDQLKSEIRELKRNDEYFNAKLEELERRMYVQNQ